MDSSVFSKVAISAAQKYLDHLKGNHLGRSIIGVRTIERTGPQRFRLGLCQKVVYLDAVELVLNPILSADPLRPSDYKIISYNEKQKYIVAAVGERLDGILAKAAPAQITLESDMTFLVKAVQNWYGKFGERISFPQKPRVDVKNIPYPENASEEQKEAIATGLSQPISYVWGAPGTGKTKVVLSGMIYPYIRKNGHVLVMAPTNNALEQSLRGVIEVLQEKKIPVNKIIRLGRPTSEFLEEYPEACEKGRMDDLMQKLGNEIQELEYRKAEQEQYQKATEGNAQFTLLLPQYKEIHQLVLASERENSLQKRAVEEACKQVSEGKKACAAVEQKLERIRHQTVRQQRYVLLSEQFQQYNRIVSRYLDRFQTYTGQRDALRIQQETAADRSAAFQKQLESAQREENLAAAQKAGFRNRIRLLLSKQRREETDRVLAALSAKTEELRAELQKNQAVSDDLTARIGRVEEQISREQLAIKNDPELYRIAQMVFRRNLSVETMETGFKAELSTYQNFQFDETLESQEASERKHLEALQRKVDSAEILLRQDTQKLRESTEQLHRHRSESGMLDQKANLISQTVFEKKLSVPELEKEFITFFGRYLDFDIDPKLDDKIKEKKGEYDTLLNNIKAMMKDRNVIACTVDYAMLHYDQLSSDMEEEYVVFLKTEKVAQYYLSKIPERGKTKTERAQKRTNIPIIAPQEAISCEDLIAASQRYTDAIRQDAHARYLSWEHCYSYFQAHRKNPTEEEIDFMCLHLAWYLASWGMLRGGAFLLWKDYKVHLPVIRLLLSPEYEELNGCSADILCQPSAVHKVMALSDKIVAIYWEETKEGGEGKKASDTLVTKILLGTLGCTPAYDRYFKSGLSLSSAAYQSFGEKSLLQLAQYYKDHEEAMERFRNKISKDRVEYTPMKVIDMCFWQVGFDADQEEE